MLKKVVDIQITAPRLETVAFHIRGTSPYMMANFAQKAREEMEAKQRAGSTATKGKKREPKDFDLAYEQSFHRDAVEGWPGIPAGGFRKASVSACRLCGFTMTLAKLCIFIEADGFDSLDGQPLVKINGEPERVKMMVRNADGSPDIRVRPMWRNWSCVLRVRYDADQFTRDDVANLIARVGMQVGIGEGRPDSKKSTGLGYGLFVISNEDDDEHSVGTRQSRKRKRNN